MKSVRAWLMRLSGVFATKRSERELSAEIESHLQLHIDDNIRAGMTPAEARRRAVIALGGVEGTKEAYRDRRGLPAFESLVRDVRYGIRSLIKTPGLRARRHRHSRPRHRRQHRDLHGGQRRGAEAAAVCRCRSHHARLAHAAARACSRRRSSRCRRRTSSIGKRRTSRSSGWRSIAAAGMTLTGQGEPEAVTILRGSADFLPILGVSPIDRPRLHARKTIAPAARALRC